MKSKHRRKLKESAIDLMIKHNSINSEIELYQDFPAERDYYLRVRSSIESDIAKLIVALSGSKYSAAEARRLLETQPEVISTIIKR